MEDYQFWTLAGMLGTGFAWMILWLRSIDKHVNDIDKRVTIIETILAMMGMPIKTSKKED